MKEQISDITKIEEIIHEFQNNIDKVCEFMKVDEELVEIVVSQLKGIQSQFNNIVFTKKIDYIIKSFDNIKNNGSVEKKLTIMYNQSIVLMTSYFSHALEQLFTILISEQYKHSVPKEAEKEEFKITLSDIVDTDFDLPETIGKMILKKEDLKFQDMKSTQRAFDKYLNIRIPIDNSINTIIVALSLRHVMVHNAGIINEKTINQTRNAKPRKIQEELVIGQQVLISEQEINCVGECMLQYLSGIADQFKLNHSKNS